MSEENDFQSNRFISFYHPPFRLLPPAMSADESRHLYFLVHGNQKPLSIHASASWDINDLKTAIISEARLNLKTSDVILSRVRLFF